MLKAYQNIYTSCGLPAIIVEADSGAIGGKDSHEFMLMADSGEDEIVHCLACQYAANVEKADSVKVPFDNGEPLPMEEVATPGMSTIEEVSGFFGVEPSQTLKAVFYVADRNLVFVTIRGDLDVNEIKLKNLLHAVELRLAYDNEVTAAGLVAGAASPVNLRNVRVVADDSVTMGSNFVAGANKKDTHLKNVNYPRDFEAPLMGEIAKARAGDGCPRCNGKLATVQGIEVGHIFKLGTAFSKLMEANFIDENGESCPVVMGCYGIGIGRLLSAAIEQNHDDKGIIWPMPIAPYQVYLSPLYRQGTNVADVAEDLYTKLEAAGLEVLFDDREESTGVKFNDADLLGIPVRVTVSPRTLEKGGAELKMRSEKDFELVPLEDIVAKVKGIVEEGMKV